MSADVLSFWVPTFPGNGSKYPSVNGMWASGVRYGKKTPEYADLFRIVRETAHAVMQATGWETATDRVEVHLKRYVPDRRRTDAGNLGKCEMDSMAPWKPGQPGPESFLGVYEDDRLVRPFPDVVYDPTPDAMDRIAIAVFRLFTETPAVRNPRPRVPAAQRSAPVPAGPVPTLNGKPITVSEALSLIGRTR
jgi:hypothetical protein